MIPTASEPLHVSPVRFSPADTAHVISLGAGVQSTTLYLMASQGLITPTPVAAIFADTGWEPPAVYAHLSRLSAIQGSSPCQTKHLSLIHI